ncbi:hypothetical protein F7725_007314, partial [Dissostichus mawsoni]
MADTELAAAVWLTFQRNRANVQKRRARLRRLMAVCSQMERINIYANPNDNVPVVQIYMDKSKDLKFDYRLSRESIEALMTLLRREKTHGWVQHMEVLLVVYWLAHGLSYSVVSRVFDVPKTTVFVIVHRMGRVKARFNQHHARARLVVERAFGMMKARWRGIFFKALKVDHTFYPK